MNTKLLVVALLGAALLPSTARADDAVIINTAVEAGGSGVTTAYFFAGGYYVVYDWNADRVSGGPRGQATLPFAAPFATGTGHRIDAGAAGFGGVGDNVGSLMKDDQLIQYDTRTATIAKGFPQAVTNLPGDFAAGVDAMTKGLGPLASFVYLFKGSKYIKVNVTTGAVSAAKENTAGWRLPAAFASRIDAAVNGAGRSIGKGYFFHGDEYVRYNWVADAPETQPQKIAPKWPGLVETLQAGNGAAESTVLVRQALTALDADLKLAVAGKVGEGAAVLALDDHFHIKSVAERRTHLPKIIARLKALETTLADPGDLIAFRTAAEVRADGQGDKPIYTKADRRLYITARFAAGDSPCRTTQVTIGLLFATGTGLRTADATTIEEALDDSVAFARLTRHIAHGTLGPDPCLAP